MVVNTGLSVPERGAGMRVPSHSEQRAVKGNRQVVLSNETVGLSLDSEKQQEQMVVCLDNF